MTPYVFQPSRASLSNCSGARHTPMRPMLPISATDKYDAAKLAYKYFLARTPYIPCILMFPLFELPNYLIRKNVYGLRPARATSTRTRILQRATNTSSSAAARASSLARKICITERHRIRALLGSTMVEPTERE